MNMWGLTPGFLDVLENGFKEFFDKEVPSNPLKAEYLIPVFIGELLEHNHTYSCISQMRRYRSNLQALFLVHPAAFIQVAVDQKQEYNC